MKLSEIHHLVQSHFTWVADKANFGMLEHWTSHADEVLDGKGFRDDCDGFALTCAEIAAMSDYPLKDISIVFCQTETGEYHLVASVNDWILDNRQRNVIGKSFIPYKWISRMWLDEPGIWRAA